MGKLIDCFTAAEKELEQALKNRNEYEKKMSEIANDKSLSAIEREEKKSVINSFIEVYEDDIETAKEKLRGAESDLKDWLVNVDKELEKEAATLEKKVEKLQKLRDELNEGVNEVREKLNEMQSKEYSMNYVANNNIVNKQEQEHWKRRVAVADSNIQSIKKKNLAAATIRISIIK